MGAIVGILSLLVTLLIGWNIYNALSLEKKISNVENTLSKIQTETKYNLDKQDKLRASTEEYAMGTMESMNGFVLLNTPTEKRYMLIYKCYVSAIMHFLRCDRNISGHITDCLYKMEEVLTIRAKANEYDDRFPNIEGFNNAIIEIINSPSKEFLADQRRKFIKLDELRKQIITKS